MRIGSGCEGHHRPVLQHTLTADYKENDFLICYLDYKEISYLFFFVALFKDNSQTFKCWLFTTFLRMFEHKSQNMTFPTGFHPVLKLNLLTTCCSVNTASLSREVLKVARLLLMLMARRDQRCEVDCAKCIMS